VVHVYEWRIVGARIQVGGAHTDDAKAHAEALVESAVAHARSFAPGVSVRGDAVQGSAGPILVGVSANADMVVVGSRGRGGFASLLLGSVSRQVATHAPGPVVVVRGRPDISGGPIVVGLDGSKSANHALGVGLEEAVARDTGVVAIRAYTPAKPPGGSGVAPHVEDWEERKAHEHQLLFDDIAQWKDKYPEVSVEAVVAAGHPAEVLIGVSSTAQLAVVGTRGHERRTGVDGSEPPRNMPSLATPVDTVDIATSVDTSRT
jgi:nucleotide-binding universal stress UspA family protein